MIDLRSDTVTRPTPEMRRAMADAVVGDDVYGEDPTVNRLEERAAEIFGKEAALYVPTGTMSNTIGLKVHTEHGQEIICDHRAHILNYELAMAAWYTGCLCRPIPSPNGILTWAQIRAEIRTASPHWSPTGLIEIENTHNMGSGAVYTQQGIDEICEGAHGMNLKVHMDGARIFNAAVASGRTVAQLTEKVDSVSACLSKGLGAPAGSLLIGRKADIERGRLHRKRLGGGMRQSGILAAAGLIALEQGPEHLPQDHENARWVAEQLAEIPGIKLDPHAVQTNIVIFDVSGTGMAPARISAELAAAGVRINPVGGTQSMRIVTHRDVSRADCEAALQAVRQTLGVSVTR